MCVADTHGGRCVVFAFFTVFAIYQLCVEWCGRKLENSIRCLIINMTFFEDLYRLTVMPHHQLSTEIAKEVQERGESRNVWKREEARGSIQISSH